jgi:nitroreductase/NAD-dependent dihydropyrimidine dehydrogenase PreA subunit
MAIPTTRTKENAQIHIDQVLCNGCGLCVTVCKDFSIEIADQKVRQTDNPVFGCIGCGHCMMICPNGAIKIDGRCSSSSDLLDLPDRQRAASPDALKALLQRRRSIREFKDIPVEKALIDQVPEAAQTAPMGLPPSDVHVLVLDSREKVHAFAKDFCGHLENLKWFISGWFLTLMRPFWGKASDEMFRGFVKPCVETYLEHMQKGVNVINYDAPVAVYFYGSPFCDPADPLIAATYAMLAAESLGLGTCMLGAIHPFIQNGAAAKRFREKHGIRHTSREGVFVIMGYPAVKYHKTIKRSFAAVDWA